MLLYSKPLVRVLNNPYDKGTHHAFLDCMCISGPFYYSIELNHLLLRFHDPIRQSALASTVRHVGQAVECDGQLNRTKVLDPSFTFRLILKVLHIFVERHATRVLQVEFVHHIPSEALVLTPLAKVPVNCCRSGSHLDGQSPKSVEGRLLSHPGDLGPLVGWLDGERLLKSNFWGFYENGCGDH